MFLFRYRHVRQNFHTQYIVLEPFFWPGVRSAKE